MKSPLSLSTWHSRPLISSSSFSVPFKSVSSGSTSSSADAVRHHALAVIVVVAAALLLLAPLLGPARPGSGGGLGGYEWGITDDVPTLAPSSSVSLDIPPGFFDAGLCLVVIRDKGDGEGPPPPAAARRIPSTSEVVVVLMGTDGQESPGAGEHRGIITTAPAKEATAKEAPPREPEWECPDGLDTLFCDDCGGAREGSAPWRNDGEPNGRCRDPSQV
ncbi:MAG: hypothetical protein M1817_000287 [Caeruleum heppii]|nr:MAG: hypothetical protein M1817_000287 [Caeruleum heppii]